ncbi:hypothetical protein PAXRUDRAFT_27582 [Paxillus rubicundulus Ve08.2h10]|uniref:Unplaced genomic scaffold scaffold_798, whole genome shotgun sequence n=1 Tax=Paxillus rubicundulus Ve08.2h10 TaxID=930991 RepID=A0A0D0DL57_9AGAM|nr:hypothetical protein PAXRUDRAFT_27582 [Paxillus rubicundulus Ve08.2h10]
MVKTRSNRGGAKSISTSTSPAPIKHWAKIKGPCSKTATPTSKEMGRPAPTLTNEEENLLKGMEKKKKATAAAILSAEKKFNDVINANLKSDVEDPKAGEGYDETEGVTEEQEIGTSEEEDDEIGKRDLFEGEEPPANENPYCYETRFPQPQGPWVMATKNDPVLWKKNEGKKFRKMGTSKTNSETMSGKLSLRLEGSWYPKPGLLSQIECILPSVGKGSTVEFSDAVYRPKWEKYVKLLNDCNQNCPTYMETICDTIKEAVS